MCPNRDQIYLDLEKKVAVVIDHGTCSSMGIPIGGDPSSLFFLLMNNPSTNSIPGLDDDCIRGIMVGQYVEPIQEIPKKSWISKVASLWDAVTGPSCSDSVFDARIRTCRGCEFMRRDGDKEYCGSCGCPNWRLSELSTKLRFANLSCPVGKFGPENG